MATVIQQRRDTTVAWEAANPVLAQGEMGVDLTVDGWKLGNGVDAWLVLPYSQGVQGIQGEDGADSIVPGPTGSQGEQGIQGVTGDTGADSTVVGPIGDAGPQGIQGITGDTGADSVVPGPTGPQGDQGIQGDTGDTGADSVVPGPAGDQGIQGIQGIQGVIGDTGADSVVPGPTGPQGDQGITGDTGADSVVAGPQGDQGIQGVIGDTGPQGDQGITGDTGADSIVAGPQGIQGIDGEQGIQGIQGITGDNGADGADSVVPGPTGPAGEDGTDGTDGIDGAPGGGNVYTSGANNFTALNTFTAGMQSYKDGDTTRVTIGLTAGLLAQGTGTIALGHNAGYLSQGSGGIAIGYDVATSNQGTSAVAIGRSSGTTTQGVSSIALGYYAGNDTQGTNSVAIGPAAAYQNQGPTSVAIGYNAGYSVQGSSAIAMGNLAGQSNQGAYSIALGYGAARASQGANGIYINSSGTLLDDTTPSHIHIASDTASLDYTTADGWTVTTPSGTLPLGATVSLDVDNTWTGINTFQGVEIEPISGNGSGSAQSTPAIINKSTQTISGSGDAFGQVLPSFVEDIGTYNLASPNLFATGRLFNAMPIINLTGSGPYGIAGAYSVVMAWPTINKTTTNAMTYFSTHFRSQGTVNNTAGGGAFSFKEQIYSGKTTLGSNVTGTELLVFKAEDPMLGTGSTVESNIGVHSTEMLAGNYNAGFAYGAVQASVGNYAFDSKGSGHPVRFGGGIVKNYRDSGNSGTVYMVNTDYHIFVVSTSAVFLPATATCEIGQIFVITNFSGASKTIQLNGGTGYGKSATIAYEDSRHFVKRSSNTWVIY